MQKIVPYLWFDTQAEEAATFYTSIFKNSRITNVSYYGEAGPRPAGTVMVVSFQLNDQDFMALNGGPQFQFSPAVAFYVDCETQAELDHYWERLREGGESHMCGWVRDKFGLSWNIVPAILPKLLSDPDTDKSQRVMLAMLEMDKLDIAGLQRAAQG